MRFQPGQSGNPAGRPLGARNKKTIAAQELFAATALETAKFIIARAQCGNSTAMRLCVERTPPDLELPTVKCADDAQRALDTVVEAFGRGAITARELPSMVAAVDRMARVVQRIEEMRAQEHERYKALRGPHGLHPDLLPKPNGVPDPVVAAMRAAGEEVPEYLAVADAANRRGGAGLYSPVNSENGSAAKASPSGAGDAAPSADASGQSENEGLYFPVNSEDALDGAVSEAAAVSGFPSPRAQRGGEGSGVGGDVGSEQQMMPPPAPACAASEGEEGNGLYFSVNSSSNCVEESSAAAVDESSHLSGPSSEAPPTPDPSPPFAARMGGGEPSELGINPG